MAGSRGGSIPSFLRKPQTDFSSCFTSLYSHQEWMNIPLSPHCCPHDFLFVLLILTILTTVRWNLKVVFTSLMTKDVDHFFKCFSGIWVSSFEISVYIHYFKIWLLSWYSVFYTFQILVLCRRCSWQKFVACTFIFFQIHCVWPYVEVFDLSGVEFCNKYGSI